MNATNGIKTIAMKVSAEELEQKRSLALTLLGGSEIYTEPGISVFALNDGRFMELYGPGSVYPEYLFEKNDVVLSFYVNNMTEAISQAKNCGMEVIPNSGQLESCHPYCYIRDKKGTIFGLNKR